MNKCTNNVKFPGLVKRKLTIFFLFLALVPLVVLHAEKASADYVGLVISPKDVGVFTKVGKQQFKCEGIQSNGQRVDITTKVDWYVEEYPLSGQTIPAEEILTIDENGLATVISSYGRAKVTACYPKGCGPNTTTPLVTSYAVKLLLKPPVAATYALNVFIGGSGSASGKVISNPTGINCGNGGADCSETFTDGQNVTLTATPATGFVHGNWSGGGCSGTTASACAVTMAAAKEVTATFAVATYNLSVTVAGTAGDNSGTIISDPAGINCGEDNTECTATYSHGDIVNLTSDPAIGYVHGNWSGGGCSGTTADACTVTMDAAKEVTATFDDATHDLTMKIIGDGNVEINPPGTTCNGADNMDCVETYTYGQAVTLTADPLNGNDSVTWSVDECNEILPDLPDLICEVTMEAAKEVTATFTVAP